MKDPDNEPKVCSICQRIYYDYGNNAYPINHGRCCDECNDLVIAARLERLFRFRDVKDDLKERIGK